MWFAEVLNIGFIVLSILVAVNVWLLVGSIFYMLFDHMDGELRYPMFTLICFTWPLFVCMSIAKQLETGEVDDHDHAEG